MFKKIILESQEKIKNLNLIRRELNIDEIMTVFKLNKIIALIGSRRSGKTFLTFQIVQQCIEMQLLQLEQIIYLDFSGFIEKDISFDRILEDYKILFPNSSPVFILDEIQELDNFPEKLISLLGMGYKILITGSNAHMLSKDLSTILRGKVYTKEIFPLTFKEFLIFCGSKYTNNDRILHSAKYKKMLSEYLKWGGFPEIVLTHNEVVKENILKTYLDVMIYKDLQDRYDIKNDFALKFIIKRVLFSYSKEFNIHKIYNELKSQNIKVGKDSLYSFYEYLKNIYFIQTLTNYWSKVKGQTKPYLIDTAYAQIAGNEDFGKRLENMVFWELQKKHKEVYFLNNTYEIDFYLPGKEVYIQVVYSLDYENYDREVRHLKKQEGTKYVIYFEKRDNIILDPTITFVHILDFIFDSVI